MYKVFMRMFFYLSFDSHVIRKLIQYEKSVLCIYYFTIEGCMQQGHNLKFYQNQTTLGNRFLKYHKIYLLMLKIKK